jgi:predicted ATPase/DNA-binding SARP family transcriptional activator
MRARTLLVALAIAQGHPVTADQLLEQVWSEERRPARNNLQVHISRLRKALGDERIVSRGGTYALALPPDACDVTRFELLVAEGRTALESGDAARASRTLRDALDLWRGSPLTEFADKAFAPPLITRLEESRLAALEDRIQADLALGRHGELIGELEALLQDVPLRERLWEQLMVALYCAGRQADALRAYQRARRTLAETLGVDPGPELRRIEAAVLQHDPWLAMPARSAPVIHDRQRRRGNLPAATIALLGREAEVEAIRTLTRVSRMVSIVGPGGVGKTRLAVEVGSSLVGEYRDGIWLVGLASVGNESAVAGAVATALGVQPESGSGTRAAMMERVGDYLDHRQALLVLDNCEHVVTEAARVAEHLLARCGDLRIVATSREPLSIAGEALWPLPPLGLDAATALFVARARAQTPSFQPDEATTRTIRSICQRLDGLPLAIELAAVRVRAFDVHDILARLNDRFRFLTAGSRTDARQQTLRAVVDWSYDLLSEDERRVFERLSVFAGGCSLAAAERVCPDDTIRVADLSGLLARLVDKSLVIAERTTGGVSFRLLSTLAEYGRQRLVTSGANGPARRRHAHWVTSIVDTRRVQFGSWDQEWFETVKQSMDEIHLAMEWTVQESDGETALAIVLGLTSFWNLGGQIGDCWGWISAALALQHRSRLPRVYALTMAAAMGSVGHFDQALLYAAEAVELAHETGNRPALAFAQMVHATLLYAFMEKRKRSLALFEQAAALLETDRDDWAMSLAALARGAAALAQADLEPARQAFRLAADRFARLGNLVSAAMALRQLADIAVSRGEYSEAMSALLEALSGLQKMGAEGMAGPFTTRLGYVCTLQGNFEQADAWLAESRAWAERQQDGPLLALAHNTNGLSLRRRGRLDEAERLHRLALALYYERGSSVGIATTFAALGYISELRDDAARAEWHHRASLDAACETPNRRGEALALEGLAGVASLQNDPVAVGRFLGAAAALRDAAAIPLLGAGTPLAEATGGSLSPEERIDIERAIHRLHDRVAMEEAFEEGQRDPEAVVAAARAHQSSPSPAVA